MNPDLEMVFLGLLLALLLAGMVLLFMLISERGKRRLLENRLSRRLDTYSSDLHGLSVAAVRSDERLLENELRIRDVLERLDDLARHEKSSQPYFDAIQEVRNGLDAEQLADRCGLTLDEAKLLVKLNRSDSRDDTARHYLTGQ